MLPDWPRLTVPMAADPKRGQGVLGVCNRCGHLQLSSVSVIYKLKPSDRWWARCSRHIGATYRMCAGMVQPPSDAAAEEAMVAAWQMGGSEAAMLVWKAAQRRENRRKRKR